MFILEIIHHSRYNGKSKSRKKPIRYGGHIELIIFKEYYWMPRGHELDPIYTRSVFTRANFCFRFPRKRL